MKRFMAMAALAAGLMIGSVANAAAVDIFLTQTNDTTWELTVSTDGSTAVGALNLATRGLDVMTVNPANTGISPLDSVFVIGGLGDERGFLVVNNNPGQAIAAAGSTGVLIATFTGAAGANVTLQDVGEFGAGSGIWNVELSGQIEDFSITVSPIVVPEPATLMLLGLGLAGLAVVRRAA